MARVAFIDSFAVHSEGGSPSCEVLDAACTRRCLAGLRRRRRAQYPEPGGASRGTRSPAIQRTCCHKTGYLVVWLFRLLHVADLDYSDFTTQGRLVAFAFATSGLKSENTCLRVASSRSPDFRRVKPTNSLCCVGALGSPEFLTKSQGEAEQT